MLPASRRLWESRWRPPKLSWSVERHLRAGMVKYWRVISNAMKTTSRWNVGVVGVGQCSRGAVLHFHCRARSGGSEEEHTVELRCNNACTQGIPCPEPWQTAVRRCSLLEVAKNAVAEAKAFFGNDMIVTSRRAVNYKCICIRISTMIEVRRAEGLGRGQEQHQRSMHMERYWPGLRRRTYGGHSMRQCVLSRIAITGATGGRLSQVPLGRSGEGI